MKTGRRLVVAIILCVAVLIWVKNENQGYKGVYVAVAPPVESGEQVIKQVEFRGKQLVMRTDEVEQAVNYRIQGRQLTLETDFGEFNYSFGETEEGFMIDGIEYIKE